MSGRGNMVKVVEVRKVYVLVVNSVVVGHERNAVSSIQDGRGTQNVERP